MKLSRLTVWIITLASAFLTPRNSFMMKRPGEHVDPIEKARRIEEDKKQEKIRERENQKRVLDDFRKHLLEIQKNTQTRQEKTNAAFNNLVAEYDTLPNDATADERIAVLKKLDTIRPYLKDAASHKKSFEIPEKFFKLFFDILNTKPESKIFEPSEKRQAVIDDIKKYADYLAKSNLLERSDKQTVNEKVKQLFNKIQAQDKAYREKIGQDLNTLQKSLKDLSVFKMADKNVAKSYLDKLADLIQRCDNLEYSFEAAAASDLIGQVAALNSVLDSAKNIVAFSQESNKGTTADLSTLKKSAISLQEQLHNIQSYLNYDTSNRTDPELAKKRPFEERLKVMSYQANQLKQLSSMLKQWKINMNGKPYPVVNIPRIADPAFEKQKNDILRKLNFGDSNNPTDLGLSFKSLAEFSWQVDRRIKQLEQYVADNSKKTKPDLLTTYSKKGTGVTIKLAAELDLNLFIPDDRIPILKKQVKAREIPYNNVEALTQYFVEGNIYDANMLQDISDLMAIQRRELAKLDQDFTEGIFAGIVNYELELLRNPDKEKAKEAAKLFAKNKLLLQGYGLEDSRMLIELNRKELAIAKKDYMDSAALESRRLTDLAAAQLMEEALRDAEKKSVFNWKEELGKSIVKGFAFTQRWNILAGILSVAVVIGGAALSILTLNPFWVVGSVTLAGSAWAAIKAFGAKAEEAIGYQPLNRMTNGLLEPTIAIGISTYSFTKAYYDARMAQPSEEQYRNFEAAMIRAGEIPPARVARQMSFLEKGTEELRKFFTDAVGKEQIAITKKQEAMSQEMWKFEYSKLVYCDFLNKQLNLSGQEKLTPTSTYEQLVATTKAFNKALLGNKKIKESERIKLFTYVNNAFNVMIEIGRKATQLQFEYAQGVHNIIAKFVYGDMYNQALVNPEDAYKNIQVTMPEEFEALMTQNYENMNPAIRKEAAKNNFLNWLNFYERLFKEHADFEVFFEQNKDNLLKPFGADKPLVFSFWKDMLDGRFEMMLKMYRSTCNAIAKTMNRNPFEWDEISAKPAKP